MLNDVVKDHSSFRAAETARRQVRVDLLGMDWCVQLGPAKPELMKPPASASRFLFAGTAGN
jgi:hypothetical protein